MKNSKIWVVVAIAFVVMVLLAGAVFTTMSAGKQKQAQNGLYLQLVSAVEDFHGSIRELSPSVEGKKALQNQVSTMKDTAETARNKIHELDVTAVSLSGSTNAFRAAVDKTDKYLVGFTLLANQRIQKESLQIKAKAMVDAMKVVAQAVESTKTLDEGDINEAIDRGISITVANAKASKPAPVTTTTVVVTGTPYYRQYWSNPSYGGYYREIQRIVAQYSAGRSALNSCLTHYDNNTFSSYDRSVWSREVDRRQQLLNDLNAIYGEIPQGSVYDSHHRMLLGMISSALSAMRSFANSPNSYNRSELSRVSANNTRTMLTLKRFYGIR